MTLLSYKFLDSPGGQLCLTACGIVLFRGLGMPNDRLPKKPLFGQVKGLRPPGRPRSSFNDVTLHDFQTRRISEPYRDAQDRLLWKDKTCPARTWLIMSWKALLLLLLLSLLLIPY